MGRIVRDARLESRTSRLRLAARSEPYWRAINEGAHLGYYRGVRGGRWVARYREPGSAKGYVKTTIGEADDVSESDGQRIFDFRQAQEKSRAWFDLIAIGGHRRGTFTVSDALDEYMDGFRGKSVTSTQSRIDSIIKPEIGDLEVYRLTAKDIAQWHHRRSQTPARLRTGKRALTLNVRPIDGPEAVRRRRSTANRDLTVLKAALNRAAQFHPGLPAEAWRNVKPFANAERAKLRYLDDDEVRRLVNAMEPAIRPIVQASLLTGARYGELCGAKVKDFDGAARVFCIPETKSGHPRMVYLEAEGLRLFEMCCAGKSPTGLIFPRPDGKRWGPSQQIRPLSDASMRAGIEHTGFHDLRRTYGARLARSGVPMAVIAEALGHADERITRRHYAHLSPSYVADTVRASASGLRIVPDFNVVPISKGAHDKR